MSKTPIFISGIGRSGTSAVIKSIAEHKDVVKPEKIGEAPFVAHFINFLKEYEDKSGDREYNLKNYRLEKAERAIEFSRLLSTLQYGKDINVDEIEGQHWIAKLSLPEDSFQKAQDIFEEIRIIYVMRNGVEVVNSAKSFEGFANLNFKQLCQRWADNINQCRYVSENKGCATIKHHELVQDPHGVYQNVFDQLGLSRDDAPADFIHTTLFNSSFDQSKELKSTANVFDDRLKSWHKWSSEEKNTFISICDELMIEFEFTRPYANDVAAGSNVIDIRANRNLAVESSTSAPSSEAFVDKLQAFEKQCKQSMPIPLFDYHANPSEKHSLLFVENPKVASTSILKELQKFEIGELDKAPINTHDRNNSPFPRMSSLDTEIQCKMLFSDEIFRSTFVRNPYSRLLSAYLSKIDNSLRPKAEILGIINGVPKKEITDLTQKVSFEEFVEVVCSMDVNNMDPHWKPQVDQTLHGLIDYNFIGRFENLNEDYESMCNQVFGTHSSSLTQSKNKTGSASKLLEMYSDNVVKMVHTTFAKDFEVFGYYSDIDKTNEYIAEERNSQDVVSR